MREVKSSGTGVVLSFFWTGLGQLYAGRIGRGLGMMAATPAIWLIGFLGGFSSLMGGIFALVAPSMAGSAASASVGLVGFVFGLAPLAWWLWGMVDAKQLCEFHNDHIMMPE